MSFHLKNNLFYTYLTISLTYMTHQSVLETCMKKNLK